jgi:hypothetical protein
MHARPTTQSVAAHLHGRPYWQWLPPPLTRQLPQMRALTARAQAQLPEENPTLPRALYLERAALLEFEIGRSSSLIAADAAPCYPQDAIECLAQGPASPSRLLSAHRLLLGPDADRRTGPAWLDTAHPADSNYVAPPAQHVQALVQDVCAFANDARWPVALRAVVVFARLLHIHPFREGNGRTARAWFLASILRELGPRVAAAIALKRAYEGGGERLSLALRVLQHTQNWQPLFDLAWPETPLATV